MTNFAVCRRRFVTVLLACVLFLTAGCASIPPSTSDDICQIFDEKGGLLNNWHRITQGVQKEYGVPVHVTMATLWQESRFRARAKPPRKKILLFIPGPRLSSAYGYSQAKKQTWRWYQQETGKTRQRRNSFRHAARFVGWYHHRSHSVNGIALDDAYNLYLAYHEGHGGYRRGTWRNKPQLLDVARRVSRQASRYQQQLKRCGR